MLLVLGDYWQPDRDERTEIGELVRRAKDQGDPGAASELAERFASLATALPEASGGLPRLVVPVPSGPGPAGDGDRPNLAKMLASSLAAAGVGEYRPSLVIKSNPTPRMRHLEPERRAEVVASAGYRANEPVAGRHIVVSRRRSADRHHAERSGRLPARRGRGLGHRGNRSPHQAPLRPPVSRPPVRCESLRRCPSGPRERPAKP